MSTQISPAIAPSAQALNTASFTPREKIERYARLKQIADNEFGFGYVPKAQGGGDLVFMDLDKRSIVTVPTKISESDFNTIQARMIEIPETQRLMFDIARAYANRTPIMLEGGTAIGKTFAVNRFAEMLYGPKAKILDFYCNGQTDVGELMGRPVPAGLSPAQLKTIDNHLKSDAGAALKAEVKRDYGKVEHHVLMARAAMSLGMQVQEGSFTFQLGVLPKAMTGTMGADGMFIETSDGPGVIVHIQEVSMAHAAVTNALFRFRGEKGKAAESVQIHELDGRLIEAGEGFFMVLSTNPVGKGFKDRFGIDPAEARALVWKRYPDELSEESMRKIGDKIFTFDKVQRDAAQAGAIINLAAYPELGRCLGEVAVSFHRHASKQLRDGEPGRAQKIPLTIDNIWKLAELMQNHQLPKDDYSGVDLVETLKVGIRALYIDALEDKPAMFDTSSKDATKIDPSSKDAAAKSANSLGAKLMGQLDEILSNEKVSLKAFREKKKLPIDIIKILADEAWRKEDVVGQAIAQALAEDAQAIEKLNTQAALANAQDQLGQFMTSQEIENLLGQLGTSL